MRNIVLLLVILIFAGCEEKTTWQLQSSGPVLVADAIITSEFKPQKVTLYQSSGELNNLPTGITRAQVKITDGTRVHTFSKSGNPGEYWSEPFAVSINKTYALIIAIDGIADTAFAQMEPITPFKNDTLIQQDGLYKFIYGGSDQPAMTDVQFDWSANQDYCSIYGNCYASATYYTINSIDVAEEFGPEKQEIWFPNGTQLIRRKYSLTAAHQDFIRSLLIETEWRGGLFDVEQGNIPTNFKHGLKGWFAACMVISDTIEVK